MTDVECVGGPHDGDRVPDHGFFWRINEEDIGGAPDADELAVSGGKTMPRSGSYVKSKGF